MKKCLSDAALVNTMCSNIKQSSSNTLPPQLLLLVTLNQSAYIRCNSNTQVTFLWYMCNFEVILYISNANPNSFTTCNRGLSLSSVHHNIIDAFVSLIPSFLVVCLLSRVIQKIEHKFSRNLWVWQASKKKQSINLHPDKGIFICRCPQHFFSSITRHNWCFMEMCHVSVWIS